MKALCLGIFLIFSQSLTFAASSYQLVDGTTITAETYSEMMRTIESITGKMGADAYRKYSDGSVAYLGKLLYMKYHIIPMVDTNGMKLTLFGYKIRDITPDGSRIQCFVSEDELAENDLFVVGLAGYSDRSYRQILMVRQIGSYVYSTAAGGTRVIPKYEMGERITKEQYLAVMSGKLKFPAVNEKDSVKPGLKKVEL